MDIPSLQRVLEKLSAAMPRRETVKTITGAGIAAVAAAFSGDGIAAKRRCRRRRSTCGGKKKCCNRSSGLIACQQFPSQQCDAQDGRRCCGLEGATCNNDFGHCDCCPGFFCSGITGQGFCQEEPT